MRLADEPESVAATDLPEELQAPSARTCFAAWGNDTGSHPALYAALRRDGRLVGLARLTDKLEGAAFDELDRATAEKLLNFAEIAVANALRVRGLERRSLQDSATGVYRFEYFQDVVRNEIEKANRYARELDRMTIDRLSLTFRGDNDTHHVSLDAGQWHCTCHYFESWGSCVHLLTLQKVFGVMLPEESQVSIFTAGQPVTA